MTRAASTSTEALPQTQTEKEAEHAKRFQLIVFEDDQHSYAYVIEMMINLFGHSYEAAYQVAYDVDFLGQAVVKICGLEEAMVGREQILHYGPDHRIPSSTSSMHAIVQEAGE